MKKTREELLALLADMSIEEKAGQLAQIPIVACMDGVSEPTGPMEELSLTPEQVVLSGSVISVNPVQPKAPLSIRRSVDGR